MQWSKEQEDIFEWMAGKHRDKPQGDLNVSNLVIRARAGTGKTTTIKQGFEFAFENSISDSSMLYCVFNKKNQIEAQGKITNPKVEVKTLHSLGFGYIKAQWGNVKPDNYIEFDRVQSLDANIPKEVVTQVVRLVSFLKNGFINPTLDDAKETQEARNIEADNGWNDKLPLIALDAMNLAKIRNPKGLISFDDMVWLPVAMNWVFPRFDLVVVDEAQDMNLPQLTMGTKACKPQGRICLVGDDRQCIYSFRGALLNGIDQFKAQLNAIELGLTVTYRCPKKVVALAQELVPDYKAFEGNADGFIETLVEEKLTDSVQVGDAILSRINAPLMRLCLAMLRKGISARIEGKDIGRTLITIVKSLKAKSVPHFMEKLNNWRNKQISRIKGRNIEQKSDLINDQADTLIAVAEVALSVGDIEMRLNSLFEDSEYAKKPAVVLSSVHKAKGLEWPNVFILAPTFRRVMKNANPTEEQNIYYVAITRAQNKLTLVS